MLLSVPNMIPSSKVIKRSDSVQNAKGVTVVSILWVLIALTGFPNTGLPNIGHAQSCNPAVINYLVRDEKGKVLTETELKSVYEKLPKTIDDADVSSGQVSFADDKGKYYWPESVDWPSGNKQSTLEFANAKTCAMHLTVVTLAYHDKKMRLIFDRDIARGQNDRRLVIDSLPFQEGTFALDLNGWSGEPDTLIPSSRWKKRDTKP
jgi:hypothetical protein